ncbi:MAG: hypothetical protein GDA67_06670 [Nitrospira sp. CR1.3]|nr:hypothetical protein [Nitrospira sp. CR1.3]
MTCSDLAGEQCDVRTGAKRLRAAASILPPPPLLNPGNRQPGGTVADITGGSGTQLAATYVHPPSVGAQKSCSDLAGKPR